jgi:hypothetical protein
MGVSNDSIETAVGRVLFRVAAVEEAWAVLRLRDELAAWMVQRRIRVVAAR